MLLFLANLGKFVCDEYLSYFGPETSITLDITLIIVGMVVYWAINVFLDTLFQRIMERIKLQIFNLSKGIIDNNHCFTTTQ